MSEAELHILRQRMDQGRLSKARRGELTFPLPVGYLRRPSGEATLDPDEQVQHVVRLVFRKFEELGTIRAVLLYLVNNNIQLGVRGRTGCGKGEVEWRSPNRATIQNMLNNPTYAGAYAYGRRRYDARKRDAGRPSVGRVVMPREAWTALIHDRFPGYISWEQYERNLAKLKANQSRAHAMGAPRRGAALLSGLAICGKCGWRMGIQYNGISITARYVCNGRQLHYGQEACQSVPAGCLDSAVTAQLLKAMQPAALELSLEVAKNIEKEREELSCLWRQRLERAAYEARRAAKQYHLVDPENRPVARQLERSGKTS